MAPRAAGPPQHVQGYYFARPAPGLTLAPADAGKFDALHAHFQRITTLELKDFRAETAPYLRALEEARTRLHAGSSLADAARGFLDLPLA